MRNVFPVRIILLAALLGAAAACSKPAEQDGAEQKLRRYVNTFARNTMNLYYLWTEEVADGIRSWADTAEPVSQVEKVRYKDASGKDIDRWTLLTDDFDSFYDSVSGNGKTYGFDFSLYYYDAARTRLCAVVNYCHADSPAARAGLLRGDVIVSVNGRTIPSKDYADLVRDELLGGDRLVAGLEDGRTLTLTAREMYEDPVLLSRIFEAGGRKTGYLAYTSFTLDSCQDLVEACRSFREAGVSALILDLRYNGGGFNVTEECLASMLAPEEEVRNGSVLSTEVYNAVLTRLYEKDGQDTRTCFRTDYRFSAGGKDYAFSTAGANARIGKLYALISGRSASASEALIGNLTPYLDITLVGERSHGKYCSGVMLEAPDFYDDFKDELTKQQGQAFVTEGKQATRGWGLYLMVSRFADKDGVTRCMPAGLAPDLEVEDNPLDGFQLGDPQETMLARALALCGYPQAAAPAARRRAVPQRTPIPDDSWRPEPAGRIRLPQTNTLMP